MVLGLGQTADGKSKDMWLLEMEGNTVRLNSAFVYATRTDGIIFFVAALTLPLKNVSQG